MRKLLVVCVAIIGVLAAGMAALLLLLDVNQFRGTIQTSLEKQLNRQVALGSMTLGLFPLAIKVNDATIGENPQFPTGRPFVTVKEIRVRAELLPLLRKEVRVDSLVLAQPVIEIVGNKAGRYNFSDLMSQPSPGKVPGNSGGSVALAEVDIEDGEVATSTLGAPNSRNVYDHIDISATDFGPGKNPHLKASARLPGGAKDSLKFEGSGNPFAGVLTVTDAPLAGLTKFAGSGLPVDGDLSGSATLHSAGPVTTVQGKLELKKATANRQDLGSPFSVDFDLSDDSGSGTLRVSRLDIHAGKIGAMRGSLTVAGGAADNVAFNFDIDKVDVAVLQQLSGPPSASPAASKSSSAPLTAKGSVHIGSLVSQGLVLSNIRADCSFDRGILTLAPLSAQAFGGTHTGSITVDTKPHTAPATLKLKLDNVDANQLLSATTSLKNTLYGLLGVSGDISVNLGDTSVMARSLNGNLSMSLTKGHLANVSVIREIASIAKFLSGAGGGQNTTNIVKLAGDMKLTNGVANTDNLQLQIDEGSVSAAGSVNLVDRSMNLKITAVIEREQSQKFGGASIGGYMQTALANRNGELVVPAQVTGTFDHPRFTPDLGAVAAMKLKSVLPTNGSIQSILGAVTGKQQRGDQSGQQNQPNPLDALDSLFHKKK
jgi:AsmA protein